MHDSSNKPARVRFAPSPTGEPHVGNIRSALFNWLYARHTGGTFILRIEDTDQARKTETALQGIMDGLRWLGLQWDEGPEVGGPFGPYFQSERLATYHELIQTLLDSGRAYYCDCTSERLDEMRRVQTLQKLPTRYDKRCRERGLKGHPGDGKHVIRHAVPLEGTTSFEDRSRGNISIDNHQLDDYVLIKSDGFPTYQFANVVDDHLMEITHVMRAEEWISSTPKHVLLYRDFGWTPPMFCHLSIILGPDRSKLSKRHGATSVLHYRDTGYLPDALFNYMALIGWNPGDDREVMTRDELVEAFSLDGLSDTNAIFDVQKLEWMNGVYLRNLTDAQLLERVQPWLPTGAQELGEERLIGVMGLLRERIRLLPEIAESGAFFFAEPDSYDEKGVEKHFRGPEGMQPLKEAQALLTGDVSWVGANLEKALRDLADLKSRKPAEYIHPLRLACTGKTVGPGLFELMAVLGSEACLRRIDAVMAKFGTV